MALSERNRHARKGESRAHALAHKYDTKKMASVVNHNHFERNHGFESAKRGEKKLPE